MLPLKQNKRSWKVSTRKQNGCCGIRNPVDRLTHVARSFARHMWLVGCSVVRSYMQLVCGSFVRSCGRSATRLFSLVFDYWLGRSVEQSILGSFGCSVGWWLVSSVVKSVGWRLRRLALLSRLTRSFEGAVGLLLGCTVMQSVVVSLVRPYRRLVAGSLGRPVGWWLRRSVE